MIHLFNKYGNIKMRTAIRPRELRAIPGMIERGNSVADIAVAFNITEEKAEQYINGGQKAAPVVAQPETGLAGMYAAAEEGPAPAPTGTRGTKPKAKGKAKGKK